MKESKTIPDLVARAQRGSAEAAGQLYERHYQGVFRYLAYRTGDLHAAEDLTGDVFLKMVQALPGYRITAATFRAWLFQIARNISIDHFRRNRVVQVEIQEQLPAIEEHPESAAERQITAERLQRAVAQLGEEQRDVVLMRFVEGMGVAEVAVALHKSEDAIKGLQRRGLIALREHLAQTEEMNGTHG